MKLSKLAITTLIIQTIMTLGLNWLVFLIFYRLNKYAFLSLKKENNDKGNFRLFFTYQCKPLSIISITLYILYLIGFSFAIMLINDQQFFYIFNYDLLNYILDNIFGAIIIAICLFFFISYSYHILIKNVYYTIYKNNHEYFDNFNEIDIYLFVVFSLITLGWFYLCYLFILGLYDFYMCLINRNINKKNYNFSNFGIISLFLIVFTSLVLSYYFFIYNEYYSNLTIYVVIIYIMNVILNYGFFELRHRLYLNNDLKYLSKNHDYKLIQYVNKKIIIISTIISLITLTYSIGFINENKQNKVSYNYINNINNCDEYGADVVCLPQNYKPNNDKFRIWVTPIKLTSEYLRHQSLITTIVNPDLLDNSERIQTAYTHTDSFYTVPGVLYNNQNSYIYIQTYYKKVDYYYIPIFNIVKNLELITDITNYKIHISILNNNVFIYDFNTDTLSSYNKQYHNIDTSRLMLDDLAITIKSSKENMYGYNIKDDTTELVVESDRFENLRYFISYVDPFNFNELIFHLYQAYNPLPDVKKNHLTDIDLLMFRYFKNPKHMTYYNDRYYLYMSMVKEYRNIDESYALNNDSDYDKCANRSCKNGEKVLTNEIKINDLIKQSSMLYTDSSINDKDDFQIGDKKEIIILYEGKADYNVSVEFSFVIKTIKQYFTDEYIQHGKLTIIE